MILMYIVLLEKLQTRTQAELIYFRSDLPVVNVEHFVNETHFTHDTFIIRLRVELVVS